MLVTKEDRSSEEYKQFWKDLAAGKTVQGEFKRMTKNGKTIWITGVYSPLLNSLGEVIKVMTIAYDITAYKK